MQRIHKYPIKIDETFSIALPADSEILDIAWNEKMSAFCVWALVDISKELEKKNFLVFSTEQDLPTITCEKMRPLKLKHRKTLHHGLSVWHIFSVEASSYEL